jgi:hypothetical protein
MFNRFRVTYFFQCFCQCGRNLLGFLLFCGFHYPPTCSAGSCSYRISPLWNMTTLSLPALPTPDLDCFTYALYLHDATIKLLPLYTVPIFPTTTSNLAALAIALSPDTSMPENYANVKLDKRGD